MYPEGRGKTSLGTPARDLLAPPLKKEKGCTMEDYNEYDDYGTGWEEAAERALDLIEAEAMDSCSCSRVGTDAALVALLTGRCTRCGWDS